jgi:hypothetical protein
MNAIEGWRPDTSGLTAGYYLSRLRREDGALADARATVPKSGSLCALIADEGVRAPSRSALSAQASHPHPNPLPAGEGERDVRAPNFLSPAKAGS